MELIKFAAHLIAFFAGCYACMTFAKGARITEKEGLYITTTMQYLAAILFVVFAALNLGDLIAILKQNIQ